MHHRFWLALTGLTLLVVPIEVGAQTPGADSRRTGTENRETSYPAGGGRVVTIKDSEGREVQREEYELDLGQERLARNTRTDPETGETQQTTYDKDGTASRETKNSDGDVTQTEQLNRDGRVTRRTTNDLDNSANDTIETFEYDSEGRLTQTNIVDAAGDIKQAQMFNYDENGNLTDASRFKEGASGSLESDGKVFYDADGNVIEARGNTDGILDPIRPPAPAAASSDTHTTQDANGTTTRVTHNEDGTYDVEVTDAFGRIISLQHLRPGPCYLQHDCPIEQRQRQQNQTNSSVGVGTDPLSALSETPATDFLGSPSPDAFGPDGDGTWPVSLDALGGPNPGAFPNGQLGQAMNELLNPESATGDVEDATQNMGATIESVVDGLSGIVVLAGNRRRRPDPLRMMGRTLLGLLTPRGMVGDMRWTHNPYGARAAHSTPESFQSRSAAPATGSRGPDLSKFTMYFTSLGNSSGQGFDMQVFNDGDVPVRFTGAGFVLEPLKKKAMEKVKQELAKRTVDTAAKSVKMKIDAYCLDFAKLPPVPGMMFRLAEKSVQQEFSPIRNVLKASKNLFDAGAFSPDSDPTEYLHSIRQWALWTTEQGFDSQSFGKAFVEHTEKNFRSSQQPWTNEIETIVKGLAPNRWNDIQKVLAAAEEPSARP